ncbi:MAG: hypothetical protein GEU82_09705 [Luteitalea sp.]|nr:hypothetical protein [Luteitalea sp.]
MTIALVFVLVYGFMAVEARRAAANERGQLARGGVEAAGDVYPIMQIAYPASFLIMLGESAVRGNQASLVAPGLVMLIAAKGLKWWAITSLGRFWTFRVIVVAGSTRVASGPYTFMRHPNYVAVIGELAGVALMTGSVVAGPLATVGFSLLILRRIAIENRALDAMLPRG